MTAPWPVTASGHPVPPGPDGHPDPAYLPSLTEQRAPHVQRVLAELNGEVEPPLPPEPPEKPRIESLADLYQPIDWHDMWARTSSEPDWLVPGIIERGRLHSIYAPKKHKKSLLTLLMVASLVTGGPLLGRPNPHGRPLRVLYLDLENAHDDIRQRLQDAGYGPGDLANLTYLSFPTLPGLDTALGAAHLLALIERYRPDLVVVDTTGRVITGKENDADTFRAFYRHTLAPIKATGTAVLRLDHAGKDPTQGQRGSSAKGDDLDTAWLITMASDDRITLRLDFQRSNHHPERIELVRYLDPLRFVRLDHVADRPEITALLADLESLRVPPDAGRPAARAALNGAGIRVSDHVLNEVIKIRKSCAQDQRTATPEDDHSEIVYGCADGDAQETIDPAQSCAAQVAHSSHSDARSDSGGAVRDLPVSRSAQASHSTPRTTATHPGEDPQICPRCHYPADRLVPPDGLCVPCAYPAGGAPDHDDTEED